MNSEHIQQIAMELEVDYGDIISKKDLMRLFNIKYPSFDSELTPVEMRKEYERIDWLLMSAMDLFKTCMREHRSMHLKALRKEGLYKIIRPDEHVAVALSHLRKTINKGFKDTKDILDATKVELLSSAEKLTLTNAQVNVQRLDALFNKQSLKSELTKKMIEKKHQD